MESLEGFGGAIAILEWRGKFFRAARRLGPIFRPSAQKAGHPAHSSSRSCIRTFFVVHIFERQHGAELLFSSFRETAPLGKICRVLGGSE